MARMTGRLPRLATMAGVGLVAVVALAGTALADDHGDGDDGHGGGQGGGRSAPHSDLVAGTPCTDTARACVDLASNRAWLVHDGRVTRGPVGISHGGRGEETPTGTFQVEWKDATHRSSEFNNAPMPWSVFFAPGGIAFHEGNPRNPSAGCVHLAAADAKAWYDDLAVGDEVQVH
jgi:L,D-transpeptidase catalytic domain